MLEDQVTATTDSVYSQLVAEMVSDAYDEVQDEHTWQGLKHRVTVDVVAGTAKYELSRNVSNGGNARNSDVRVCKSDSELLFEDDCPQAWMYNSDSDIDDNGIIYVSPEDMRRVKANDRTDTNSDPSYFTVYPDYDSTGTTVRLYVEFYPIPAATRVFEAYFWTKDTELQADGTTDSQVILVPHRPVYHLALMYVLNERGEELGEPGNVAELRYANSLATARMKDMDGGGRAHRYDWERE